MGVRILENKEDGYKCLYCSVTMWAFGPIFYKDEDPQEFLEWLGRIDPRSLTDKELENKVYDWRKTLEESNCKICGEPINNAESDLCLQHKLED